MCSHIAIMLGWHAIPLSYTNRSEVQMKLILVIYCAHLLILFLAYELEKAEWKLQCKSVT